MTAKKPEYKKGSTHFRVNLEQIIKLLGEVGYTRERLIEEGVLIPVPPVRVVRFKKKGDGE